MQRIAIVGGGLGGLTCAKYLADAGMNVRIYEGLPFLGGRASTFRDDDGEWIEQGLHLFLGSYSEFRTLLTEIGRPAEDILYWIDQLHLHDPQGPAATYGVNPIFAPLRTILGALSQNDYLGPLDKLSLAPLTAPALTSIENLRSKYDSLTVTEWWRQTGGTDDVLERVLRPFCRAVQFSEPEQFSAFDFLGWAHQSIYGLLQLRLAGYKGAREELIFRPLAEYLQQRGATVQTGIQLRQIEYEESQKSLSGLLMADGQRVVADVYVIAIPAWAFAPLIPMPLRRLPYFEGIAKLPVAPAISVQLWLDRVAADNPDFYLVCREPTPVYQEQSQLTYRTASGGRISVIVSPADHLLDWEDEALVRMVHQSLGKVNAAIAAATVTKSVVLKHPQHLVRPLPFAMSSRPKQATPVPNLFLAGDWTSRSSSAAKKAPSGVERLARRQSSSSFMKRSFDACLMQQTLKLWSIDGVNAAHGVCS